MSARVLLERFVLPLHHTRRFDFDAQVRHDLKVRVVQHKQSRELYALKYINKTKCVKMKAVANIVQERRLLEEVRFPFSFIPFFL